MNRAVDRGPRIVFGRDRLPEHDRTAPAWPELRTVADARERAWREYMRSGRWPKEKER